MQGHDDYFREIGAKLKSSDPDVAFGTIAEIEALANAALRAGDTETSTILHDMIQYNATSISQLATHYDNIKRRATMEVLLKYQQKGEVAGQAAFYNNITSISTSMPFIVLFMSGWSNYAFTIWHLLKII